MIGACLTHPANGQRGSCQEQAREICILLGSRQSESYTKSCSSHNLRAFGVVPSLTPSVSTRSSHLSTNKEGFRRLMKGFYEFSTGAVRTRFQGMFMYILNIMVTWAFFVQPLKSSFVSTYSGRTSKAPSAPYKICNNNLSLSMCTMVMVFYGGSYEHFTAPPRS